LAQNVQLLGVELDDASGRSTEITEAQRPGIHLVRVRPLWPP
jgi:hypothetical protein